MTTSELKSKSEAVFHASRQPPPPRIKRVGSGDVVVSPLVVTPPPPSSPSAGGGGATPRASSASPVLRNVSGDLIRSVVEGLKSTTESARALAESVIRGGSPGTPPSALLVIPPQPQPQSQQKQQPTRTLAILAPPTTQAPAAPGSPLALTRNTSADGLPIHRPLQQASTIALAHSSRRGAPLSPWADSDRRAALFHSPPQQQQQLPAPTAPAPTAPAPIAAPTAPASSQATPLPSAAVPQHGTTAMTPLEKALLAEVASLKAELEKKKKAIEVARALSAVVMNQREELEILRQENSDLRELLQRIEDGDDAEEKETDPLPQGTPSASTTSPPAVPPTAAPPAPVPAPAPAAAAAAPAPALAPAASQPPDTESPRLQQKAAGAPPQPSQPVVVKAINPTSQTAEMKELSEMRVAVLAGKSWAKHVHQTKEKLNKWLKKRPPPTALIAKRILLAVSADADPRLPRRWSSIYATRASVQAEEYAMKMPVPASDPPMTGSVKLRRTSHDPSPFFEIGCADTFKTELGTKSSLAKLPPDLADRVLYETPYESTMATKPHNDFVGWITSTSPVVVSISGEIEQSTNCYRALIRTQDENYRVILMDSTWVSSAKPKVFLKTLQLLEPSLAKVRFLHVTAPDLVSDLVAYERRVVINHSKIGVLYAREGQTEEADMFSNNDPSADFKQFLELLGDRVNLLGWKRFAADLDTRENATGTESVFREFRGVEIMFHVSTMLPFSATDPQQIARKSKVGNDVVVIVFKEGATPFPVHRIKSTFSQVYILVQPVSDNKYRVSIANKVGIAPYGPFLPDPPLFSRSPEFITFLLTKCLNAEQSAKRAPAFATTLQNVRKTSLEAIVKRYSPASASSKVLLLGGKKL